MAVLDGRVITITGAAGGLGRAYAHACAEQGALLVLNDIGAKRDGSGFDPCIIDGVVSDILAAGGEAVGNAEDITLTDGAARTLEQALDTYGRVDGLVNSGGLLRDRMFTSMSPEEWDAVIVGHLRSHFSPMQAFAAHWRAESKAGRQPDAAIVTTTSNAGLFSQPGQSNYAAAKAGIAGLTVTLADELDRYGVRVNAISPAARTRMTTEVQAMAEMVAAPADPDAFDVFDPANVASVVAWLCSPTCTATGQVLFVRGGELKVLQGWRYAEERERDGQWTVDDLATTFADHQWERTPRA
ncbi:MAG: NAD(P)-dependent dehydrogenase (short-subunit alcohol dehydrogenase family) [Glaciecola sp.]|jgi:NAD(P)-dependent dehydrogenase (short-subunit alcohol dehydrogenase family)